MSIKFTSFIAAAESLRPYAERRSYVFVDENDEAQDLGDLLNQLAAEEDEEDGEVLLEGNEEDGWTITAMSANGSRLRASLGRVIPAEKWGR